MNAPVTQTEAMRALYGEPTTDDLAQQLRAAIDGISVQLEVLRPPSAREVESFASALAAASRLAARLADALRREGSQ